MIRKLISTFLALLLCFTFAVSVSAEETTIDFVSDELGCLTDDEITALNRLGESYYDMTGVGIFFVYTQAESVEDYDAAWLLNGITDYVIMVENEAHWCVQVGGLGETIDTAAEDALRAAYDADQTYVGGIAAFMDEAVLYFSDLTSDDASEIVPMTEEQFLFDEADLLTEAEETELTQKLMEVSHSYNAQLVVVTLASMDEGDIDSFVDYLYDNMGFGYGENHDGVLMLVCMDPREYRILSNGYAGVAIDPDDIGAIGDLIVSDLSGGDYADAFGGFVEECAYYLDGHLNGFPFDAGATLISSLFFGIVCGVIVAFVLKGQLKSVRKQYMANVYVKSDSMHLNISNDIFLYRNVTRTEKPKNDSSHSSGSSGGTARSKGGGSF